MSLATGRLMRPKYLILILALSPAACSTGDHSLRRGRDAYPGYAAMSAAYTEGLDYSREVYDRGSRVSVFAPHGGDIEAVTSRVARRVAGKEFNLYIFNGWLGRDSGRMHVTSARFDDPAALGLAERAELGISVHAQADRGAWVCIGGANRAAAQLVAKRLHDAGFAAETPCERLPGKSPRNIVNRPARGGVQLELTLRLLSELEKDGEYLSKFSEAVRMAAVEFLNSSSDTGDNR